MVKKVVYTDGENVVVESIDTRLPDHVYENRMSGRGFSDAVVIDDSTLPADKEYSAAWTLSGSTVSVNITTAKEIHKDILRAERKPLFVDLDRLYVEAVSQNKDLTAIKARQQYLRDITSDAAIDSATTTTDLKAVTISSWTAPDLDSLDNVSYFDQTDVSSNSYTAAATDEIIGISHTSTEAVTVTLPEISTITNKKFFVKDEAGNAGTNNITVLPSGSDTIEGSANMVLDMDYDSIELYNAGGTTWFLKKPKNIEPSSGSKPTIFYASSEKESGTTSTSWQQKLKLTFTANASAYAIYYSMEIANSRRNYYPYIRMQVDDTDTFMEQSEKEMTANSFDSLSGCYVTTLTAGSHDIDIDFRTHNKKGTAKVRRARIIAMEVDQN